MLSHNTISFIKALHLKKKRLEHGLFLAEGDKLVKEMLASSFIVKQIYALPDWLRENSKLLNRDIETNGASQAELERVSTLVTAPSVMAVVEIPEVSIEPEELLEGYTLVLDGIRDPGNLGTMIRTADWFGIHRIIASDDCAEHWSPKVVQASMGSLTRVRIASVPLRTLFKDIAEISKQKNIDAPAVYGTFLEGNNIYEEAFAPSGFIVIGNESNGIRKESVQYIDRKISVPSFVVEGKSRPESLNAAVATALVLGELRRQQR